MRVFRKKLQIHRYLIVLLSISLFLNFWGITRGLPNTVDWDPDSIVPLGPLVYAKELLFGEPWSHKYPAFHFLVLATSFSPYLGWLWLTGQWQVPDVYSYPYGFAHPETALSICILIARCISALMAVGTVWIAYYLGKALFGKIAGFFAALLFACSPLTIYYAHTGNLDIPYLFWTSLALLMVIRLLQEPTARRYGLLGVFVALAIATKDQAYALFTFIPLVLVVFFLRGHLENDARQFWQRVGLGLLSATGVYLLASNILFNLDGWLAHVDYITGFHTARYQVYERTVSGYFGLATHSLTRLIPALNVPVFLCCLSGVILVRRRNAQVLLVSFGSYFLTFLCVVMYVYPRFVLPLVFLLLPFAGYVLARLWQTENKAARSLVAAIVAYTLCYGFSVDLQFSRDARYQAERWMAANFPPGTIVGTDAQPAYLPRFPPGVKVISVKVTPDGVQSADGSQPPYLILSEAHYRRYKAFDLAEPGQQILALMGRSLGYEIVAAFDDTLDDLRLFAFQLLPYASPTIIILKQL